MTKPNFRWDNHGQSGTYWTKEERAKAIYIAKRAMRTGCDAMTAVRSYMGMDEQNARLCVDQATNQLNGEYRRPAAAGAR